VKLDRAALEAHPLPSVKADSDKESKGRILVVAGSRDVPGAALLTATAAMRAGAGQLRIATVDSVAIPLGVQMPEAMVVGLADDGAGGFATAAVQSIVEQAGEVDAVVAGPGVRRSEACAAIATALIESRAALVLDVAFLKALRPSAHDRHTTPVLLPDADELASLLDCDKEAVGSDPVGCGFRAARTYRSVVLVKGPPSRVVCPSGDVWTQEAATPGLGVSGSGDVLAGIVGGLLARGAEPLNALLWGVWLHSEAGAGLAKKVGPVGFLARQIADEIPGLLPR
jgi:ADP-dependent NAD(P)H-hydrate dehydratase